MRSEVNSGVCVIFNCIVTSKLISQPSTLYIFIWPRKVTHALELTSDLICTPLIMTSQDGVTPWINFKAVFIFIDLAQQLFCLTYKTGHLVIIDCHTHQWFFNWGKTRCWFIWLEEKTNQIPHTFRVIFQTVYIILIHPVHKTNCHGARTLSIGQTTFSILANFVKTYTACTSLVSKAHFKI